MKVSSIFHLCITSLNCLLCPPSPLYFILAFWYSHELMWIFIIKSINPCLLCLNDYISQIFAFNYVSNCILYFLSCILLYLFLHYSSHVWTFTIFIIYIYNIYVFIYMYIYICVCAWVCIPYWRLLTVKCLEMSRDDLLSTGHRLLWKNFRVL